MFAKLITSSLVITCVLGQNMFLFEDFVNLNSLTKCDYSKVSVDRYEEYFSAVDSIHDFGSCMDVMELMLRVGDLDKNGHMDKCEYSKFCVSTGEHIHKCEEYSKRLYHEDCYRYCLDLYPNE